MVLMLAVASRSRMWCRTRLMQTSIEFGHTWRRQFCWPRPDADGEVSGGSSRRLSGAETRAACFRNRSASGVVGRRVLMTSRSARKTSLRPRSTTPTPTALEDVVGQACPPSKRVRTTRLRLVQANARKAKAEACSVFPSSPSAPGDGFPALMRGRAPSCPCDLHPLLRFGTNSIARHHPSAAPCRRRPPRRFRRRQRPRRSGCIAGDRTARTGCPP